MNDIKNAILTMRKGGAAIFGATYTDAKGKRTERDLQIGVNLGNRPAPFGRYLDGKGTIIEHEGRLYVKAVDRNKARALREFNPDITPRQAAENSVQTFRLDRINSIRHYKVELARA